MKINISCESCFHEFSVSEQLLGRRVKCPSCGEAVRVVDPDDDKPVAKSRRGTTSRNKNSVKRMKKGGKTALFAGIGVLSVLLLGLAVWGGISFIRSAPNRAIAKQSSYMSEITNELDPVTTVAAADSAADRISQILKKQGDSAKGHQPVPAHQQQAPVKIDQLPAQFDRAALDALGKEQGRLMDAIQRIDKEKLMTEKLLTVFRDSTLLNRYVATVKLPSELPVDLPEPELSQEECYANLVELGDQIAAAVDKAVDLPTLREQCAVLRKLLDEEYALMRRLGTLAAPMPPEGMSPQQAARMNAATERRWKHSKNTLQIMRGEIPHTIDWLMKTHFWSFRSNPFVLNASLRAAGKNRLANINVVNSDELGDKMEVVLAILVFELNAKDYQRSGKRNPEDKDIISLVPVAEDLNAVAAAITIGEVGDINPDARALSLTVNAKELADSLAEHKYKLLIKKQKQDEPDSK